MGGSPGAPPGGTDYRVQYQSELPEVMGRKLGLTDAGVALGQGQAAFDATRAPGAEDWATRWGGALDPRSLPQQQIAGGVDMQSTIPSQYRGKAQDIAGGTGGIGGYQDYLTRAQDYATKAADPTSYQDFLNPYQDYVTRGIEDQFGKAQTAAAAQGVQTGAFGGARQGLQTAELSRQQAEAVGGSLAQGYGQAQQMAQNVYGGASQQQAALGQQQQQMAMGDISTLMQVGAQEQGLQQQVYDEEYRRGIQEQYEPYQRLGFVSDIMQGAPTSASSLAMATTPQANPLAQAVGAGISGLALYQGYQNLAGGKDPSDIRLKEDIELVGKSPTGINIYSFKYKDKEGKYEGVMAHEVPWASEIADNGYYAVDYSKVDVDFKKIN